MPLLEASLDAIINDTKIDKFGGVEVKLVFSLSGPNGNNAKVAESICFTKKFGEKLFKNHRHDKQVVGQLEISALEFCNFVKSALATDKIPVVVRFNWNAETEKHLVADSKRLTYFYYENHIPQLANPEHHRANDCICYMCICFSSETSLVIAEVSAVGRGKLADPKFSYYYEVRNRDFSISESELLKKFVGIGIGFAGHLHLNYFALHDVL